MSAKMIQTPLLRYAIIWYRFTGTYIVLSQASLASLLYHLLLNGLILYDLYAKDPFQLKSLAAVNSSCSTTTASGAPFFRLFLLYGPKYTFTVVYFVQIVHFAVKGQEIIGLLDEPCLSRQAYQCKAKSVYIFLVITLFNVFSFIGYITERKEEGQVQQFSFSPSLISYLAEYAIFSQQLRLCLVLHYAQHGTSKSLEEIEWRLANNNNNHNQEAVLADLQRITTVNRRLNQNLSTMMLWYVLINVISTILIFTIIFNCHIDYAALVHQILSWLYLFVVIQINAQNVQTFRRIMTHLKECCERRWGQVHLSKQELFNSLRQKKSARVVKNKRLFQADLIRLTEATHIYERHFSISAFQLYSIDGTFMLQVALFVASYVVFFTQTS